MEPGWRVSDACADRLRVTRGPGGGAGCFLGEEGPAEMGHGAEGFSACHYIS